MDKIVDLLNSGTLLEILGLYILGFFMAFFAIVSFIIIVLKVEK